MRKDSLKGSPPLITATNHLIMVISPDLIQGQDALKLRSISEKTNCVSSIGNILCKPFEKTRNKHVIL